MHDLVIKNAIIIDGTGAPARPGAIAVSGGRITAVLEGAEAAGARGIDELDAAGRAVAPGFIDLHSHADFTIQGAPAAETQLRQGVTTALVGNCGSSPFPTDSVETIRRAHSHLTPTLEGEWTDTAGFAAAIAQAGPGINVCLQVGLSAVRRFVVGSEERAATSDEIAAMRAEIAKAAAQGARGFSSGLIYAPGSYSSREEMVALVGEAARHGLLYSTHMRNEAGQVLEAVEEALATAEAAGARLEISHLKAMGPENHGKPAEALRLIEQARERGVDVTADVYPYTASSTNLNSRLPGWALDGGKPALVERLRDPEQRRRIASALAARFGRDVDPGGVVIADVRRREGEPDWTWTIGRSLVDIGGREGCSPEEAAMRILEAHEGGVSIINHAMSPDDVEFVLRHPLVSVASDGWTMTATGPGRPHPRSFGTFARVLGHYARERGTLGLEEAVRKMSSMPASRIGLADRGEIREDAVADLVVFDPEAVGDRATFQDPWQLAEGVEAVLLAGRFAIRDGELLPERLGQVL